LPPCADVGALPRCTCAVSGAGNLWHPFACRELYRSGMVVRRHQCLLYELCRQVEDGGGVVDRSQRAITAAVPVDICAMRKLKPGATTRVDAVVHLSSTFLVDVTVVHPATDSAVKAGGLDLHVTEALKDEKHVGHLAKYERAVLVGMAVATTGELGPRTRSFAGTLARKQAELWAAPWLFSSLYLDICTRLQFQVLNEGALGVQRWWQTLMSNKIAPRAGGRKARRGRGRPQVQGSQQTTGEVSSGSGSEAGEGSEVVGGGSEAGEGSEAAGDVAVMSEGGEPSP
jgi:hypothetical protein